MSITAERAVLAMGSYTNLFPVASRRLPVTVETETLMLSTVSDADGERLADAPVVTFSVDDPFIADIYMTPPLVYPDGKWKVKLGCNTTADRFPYELSELQAWFHDGLQGDPGEGDVSDAIRSAVSGLWPGLDFVDHELMPCVITMTADDHPIIDWIDDTTVVATGGNGIGAKSSDGWGGLAADLVTDTAWPEWLDPKSLALDRFEDQTVRL